jgi:acyl carrier protein
VDYAIAGGVNMILGNRFTDIMGNSGFLSRENRCKTFDSSADGYVRAEGGGLVLMANQSLAGRYYAEMPGSSVNQNGGRSQVITAPHPEAQEDLILEACRDAGISPLDIDYVECHGTGTKIGDPIEVTAIQNTIARNRDRVCYLGSVKSNIGHLESAAGIAGVIKALLVFQHGAIPPDLHFNTPNPFVDFDSYRLKVVSEETPVSRETLVGISSFGFGGANAHVILKGAESPFRKEAGPFVNPFDRNRAVPVTGYAEREATSPVAPPSKQDDRRTSGDVRTFVRELFFRLTGIETVDPDIPLFEQGLDSLGAAELINAIETEYGLNLDPDILFDVPMIDGFVRAIEEKCKESGGVDGNVSRSDVADLVARLFTQLTTYETLDPAVELVEQGLTSLSMAELVSQVETAYGISLDPDIIFECPFFDQLVDKIHSLVK